MPPQFSQPSRTLIGMNALKAIVANGDIGEMVDPETGEMFRASFECEAALRVEDDAAFSAGTSGMGPGEIEGWIASQLAATVKTRCAELVEGSSVPAARLFADARALVEPVIGPAIDASVTSYGLRFAELRRFVVTSPDAERIQSARAAFASAAGAASGQCKACGAALGVTANFCFACGARQ
jgi:hypothetical protein